MLDTKEVVEYPREIIGMAAEAFGITCAGYSIQLLMEGDSISVQSVVEQNITYLTGKQRQFALGIIEWCKSEVKGRKKTVYIN